MIQNNLMLTTVVFNCLVTKVRSLALAKLDLKKSGVIWVSGYSSSGKTTVGQRLEYLLRKEGHSTIFLDGIN